MSFQGSFIGWVADHRRHHMFTDRPGDPHSPVRPASQPFGRLRGLFHAHIGWFFKHESTSRQKYTSRPARRPRPGLDRQAVRSVLRRNARDAVRARLLPSVGVRGAAFGALIWAGVLARRAPASRHVVDELGLPRLREAPVPNQGCEHQRCAARRAVDGRVLAQRAPRLSEPGAPRRRPVPGRQLGRADPHVRTTRVGEARAVAGCRAAQCSSDCDWSRSVHAVAACAALDRQPEMDPSLLRLGPRWCPTKSSAGREPGPRLCPAAWSCSAWTAPRSCSGATTAPEALRPLRRRRGRLEDLQFTLGEGPGIDAHTSGRPVFEPDLGNSTLWPGSRPRRTRPGCWRASPFRSASVPSGSARSTSIAVDQGPDSTTRQSTRPCLPAS